jgi:hypothetical protein
VFFKFDKARVDPVMLSGLAVLILATAVLVVQSFHGRTFWLDEAMVYASLEARNPFQILFAGPLVYGQQFPRIYLALIDLLKPLGQPYVVLRLLPALFCLGSAFVWVKFVCLRVKDQDWNSLQGGIASLFFIANANFFYYGFELKPYSADLFFSTICFLICQDYAHGRRWNARQLILVGLAALCFSYTALFTVIPFILVVVAIQLKLQKDRWVWGVGTTALFLGFSFFLYRIDFRHGAEGAQNDILKAYWREFFPSGEGVWRKGLSLLELYKHSLFDWWRTEYGPINESLAPAGAPYVLPYRTLKHPDLRNLLTASSLLIMLGAVLRCFRRHSGLRPRLVCAGFLLSGAALSILGFFPWGQSRLTLYLLPVSTFLIIESFATFETGLRRFVQNDWVVRVIWLPIGWLALRNLVFVIGVFSFCTMREDLKVLYPEIEHSGERYLVVGGSGKDIVAHNPLQPKNVTVLCESDISRKDIGQRLRRERFLFLWVHDWPNMESGLPTNYEGTHRASPLRTAEPAGMGLYLMTPIGS